MARAVTTVGRAGITALRSLRGLVPLVLLLALWQVVGDRASITFPPPSTWITAIGKMSDEGLLAPAISATLQTYLISLAAAAVIGGLLGVSIGMSRRLDRALSPMIDFIRSTPPVVIIPVMALLLGVTLRTSIVVATIAIMWPIVLNCATSIREMPPVRRELATVLGLTHFERFFKVMLPSVAPGFIVGLRIAVVTGLLIALLVDILGSGHGLGRLLIDRQDTFDAAGVWAITAMIGAAGYLSNVALDHAERRLLRNWQPGGSAAR